MLDHFKIYMFQICSTTVGDELDHLLLDCNALKHTYKHKTK